MKILNPLSPQPKPKRKKKPNKAERFINDIENQMFSKADENFAVPLNPSEDQTEVMRADALGLSNVSVRRKVVEYLPQLETLKSKLGEGKPLTKAMEECGIPVTLETRKALEKAFQLDFIIAHRSSPDIERMMVQAARSKFLTEAVLKGDSKGALKWAQLIQDDASVFEQKKERVGVMMNRSDLENFLESEANEEAIEADYELILEKSEEGETKE